jgi:hypothetical protein
MSTIKVDTIRNYDSAVDFSQGFNIGGASIIQNYTESADMPETPTPVNGDYWWDTANNVLYRYMDGGFRALGVTAAVVSYGDRGFSIGDDTAATYIDYWDMTTSGNSADFGDLTAATNNTPVCCDGTYMYAFNRGTVNIDYFASATLGNASDFGDQRFINTKEGVCECDGTIAVQVHGKSNNTITDVIDKFSVGTAGVTATAFGGVSTISTRSLMASFANSERMMTVGGKNSGGGMHNIMDFITFATESNATDAGDLVAARGYLAGGGTGAGDIGLAAGGYTSTGVNTIDRKDITTTSNATDHGDLTQAPRYFGGCANATKAHFFGGYVQGVNAKTNRIEETTLATAGNATDFGDLTGVRQNNHGASGPAS